MYFLPVLHFNYVLHNLSLGYVNSLLFFIFCIKLVSNKAFLSVLVLLVLRVLLVLLVLEKAFGECPGVEGVLCVDA